MGRKIVIPAPTLTPPEPNTWTLQLRTITPMFGGSATPREVDAQNPVRPASVRGHLRFWWRATAGARYSSPGEMFKAEEALWGSAEQQGKVALKVTASSVGAPLKPSSLGERVKPYERFLVYPFLGTKSDPEALGYKDVTFHLEVVHNDLLAQQETEVRSAIRAWIAFGGIGGRTRRGLGALDVSKDQQQWLPKDTKALREWFSGQRPTFGSTYLSGACAIFSLPVRPKQSSTPAEEAWRQLSSFWARFRKGHYIGKYPEYSAMGGAMWEDHKKLKALRSSDSGIALAKPHFGLPLIYQKLNDSFAGELVPLYNGSDKRMASPIILKPVAFTDGSVRGMVLVLTTPELTRIKVKGQALALDWPGEDKVARELGAKSPLEAVIEAAKRDGFTEEVRL